MMRTTILVTAALLLMLSASTVYAQRVESALVDGHPVINCAGMSSLVYTTETKGTTEEVLKTAAANATVYKRFAVHKSDNNSSPTWSNAFTLCSSVSGGVWRLPTQRELMLMWVLKRELEKTSGFTKFSAGGHWSATESNNSIYSWDVSFNDGFTYTGIKTNTCRVRCVREI